MREVLSLEALVAQAPNQVSCDLDGEAAILDTKSGIYYGLNPVGAAIWELIREPRSGRAVLEALVTRYDAPRQQLETDLLRLLAELQLRGLVTVGEEAAKARA
jgi:hypothetical protein